VLGLGRDQELSQGATTAALGSYTIRLRCLNAYFPVETQRNKREEDVPGHQLGFGRCLEGRLQPRWLHEKHGPKTPDHDFPFLKHKGKQTRGTIGKVYAALWKRAWVILRGDHSCAGCTEVRR
jgi:hypothetical protein